VRKLLASVVVALAVPAVALATKPPAPNTQGNHSKAAPKVLYILKGTLTKYTAADGSTNGSVEILVNRANRHGAALKTLTLTFAVSSQTRVVFRDGAGYAANDKGIVKVRGPKKVGPNDDLATVLQALTAKQVVDQGAAT
jgi:hypothetical protein